MIFLPRDLHQWRLSMRMLRPRRTTHWRPQTLTTAATGTTLNPVTTPTPTFTTMETLARPSPPLLVPPETHQPKALDTATRWCRRPPRLRCRATRSPLERWRHHLPMAATRFRPPRLWWSRQTPPLHPPLWCAAMGPWASNLWWPPRTDTTCIHM